MTRGCSCNVPTQVSYSLYQLLLYRIVGEYNGSPVSHGTKVLLNVVSESTEAVCDNDFVSLSIFNEPVLKLL